MKLGKLGVHIAFVAASFGVLSAAHSFAAPPMATPPGGLFIFPAPPPPYPEITFKDNFGVTYHVETDGLHLSAVGENGRLLWKTDPLHMSHVNTYYDHPHIVSLDSPLGDIFGYKKSDIILVNYYKKMQAIVSRRNGRILSTIQD